MVTLTRSLDSARGEPGLTQITGLPDQCSFLWTILPLLSISGNTDDDRDDFKAPFVF